MTDRQNRVGYKGTGQATDQDIAMDRRERLRRLAMEHVDLSKDPYLLRNHVGTYECRLCLTVHANEGSYLAHSQGKKHQVNLARRQLREKQLAQQQGLSGGSGEVTNLSGSSSGLSNPVPSSNIMNTKTNQVRIGRPGYRVTKQRCPKTKQKSLLFEIELPSIEKGCTPRYRVMSAYEQKVDLPADGNFQYLLISANPYEIIGFKIPGSGMNYEIDPKRGPESLHYEGWDPLKKLYTLQIMFRPRETKELPSLPEQTRTTNLAFHGGGGFIR